MLSYEKLLKGNDQKEKINKSSFEKLKTELYNANISYKMPLK